MKQFDGLTIDHAPCGGNGKATLTVRLDGAPIAVDVVNLSKEKERAAFAAKVCDGRPGIDAKAVEAELLRLAAEAVTRSVEKPTETSSQDSAALLAAMPEPTRAEARALLDSPNLMQTVVEDIGLLGVAGEKELGATLYLVGVSRMLPHPLAAITQGPSSSGKSFVTVRVAGLFPPESVLMATQLTPQSLFYLDPGSLVHRLVVVGERSRAEDDEAADATRALRQMLSEGKLSKLVPVKEDGRQRTVLIEQDGPIAYIESTTLTRIFDEDANRAILLNTDERPEQTRRILTATAAAYGGGVAVDAQGIIDRHHALQRMLGPSCVVVPFAERLAEAIDHHHLQTRRAFPHLMHMIQASALLHQRQRRVDGSGRLLADASDYQLARHLETQPIGPQAVIECFRVSRG